MQPQPVPVQPIPQEHEPIVLARSLVDRWMYIGQNTPGVPLTGVQLNALTKETVENHQTLESVLVPLRAELERLQVENEALKAENARCQGSNVPAPSNGQPEEVSV